MRHQHSSSVLQNSLKLLKNTHNHLLPLIIFYKDITVPVEQQIQHLLGGGEGSVGAEEDGDVGGVFTPERRHHVLHQPLQRAGLDGPHLAGLVEAEGRVRLHAQPSLPLTGRLVELHLPQRDGEDGVLLGLLADLLRRALGDKTEKKLNSTDCLTFHLKFSFFLFKAVDGFSCWNKLFKYLF